jgi:uncharacterized protein YacL
MDKENVNRDIDLQKIQILSDDFQAYFNVGASIGVGGLIGLLILALTAYYNKQFSSDVMTNLYLTLIAVVGVYILFFVLIKFLDKRSNEFLAFVDKLQAKVEKGENLPLLTKLKKRELE